MNHLLHFLPKRNFPIKVIKCLYGVIECFACVSGLEKEFDQRYLPDGKVNVDGFLVVFDVSLVPNRTLEKQVENTAHILNSLMKTKKPIVLATTKNDEGNEIFIREAERLLNRKEYKGLIPLVETSSHENINVDQAFFLGEYFPLPVQDLMWHF